MQLRIEQVLYLVAAGRTDKEIAVALGISVATVRTYLQRYYKRHSLHSRAAAAVLWTTKQLETQQRGVGLPFVDQTDPAQQTPAGSAARPAEAPASVVLLPVRAGQGVRPAR